LVLLSSRFFTELRVGRVGRRSLGTCAALEAILFQTAEFLLMITTPSLLMRWSHSVSRRVRSSSGRDDAVISKRRCTAQLTLFTFCPPAPCARMAVISTSSGGIKNAFGIVRQAVCCPKGDDQADVQA